MKKRKRSLEVRRRKLMRYGMTRISSKFGVGGYEKADHNRPRPITLATVDIKPVKP